ncbi:MAG: hypothetical protein GVY22_04745 [Gammaproteobacteria bacterium]|nr:hypothetical protein [Gammaproteobacteria bacterium]
MFATEQTEALLRFGFKFGRGGVHAARTMMLPELQRLLEALPEDAEQADYRAAVVDTNLLDKPSLKARKLGFEHLCSLYALDPNVCLFRVLRRLWHSDAPSQPVLALSMALARDALLRLSAPLILEARPGVRVSRDQMAERFATWGEGRFSASSVEAIAQRVNGTWTQAGYLTGRVKKVRAQPGITPVNLAFALFLAYLDGRVAQRLFTSDWVRVLDLPQERLIELTQAAAQRGLLVFRRTGAVMEVRFPGYLTEQEQEWLNEQA